MSAGPILLALWAATNTELSFVHLTSILGLLFTDSLVATGPFFAGRSITHDLSEAERLEPRARVGVPVLAVIL